MDIASVSSLLGSLKTATDIVKLIRESDTSLERAETKLKLADLISALADAKLDAAEVQQAIIDKNEEIRQLKATAKLNKDMIWRQPCYFLANEAGIEEPYCQKCYDAEKKLARLHTDDNGYYKCWVCKHSFTTEKRERSNSAQIKKSLSTHVW